MDIFVKKEIEYDVRISKIASLYNPFSYQKSLKRLPKNIHQTSSIFLIISSRQIIKIPKDGIELVVFCILLFTSGHRHVGQVSNDKYKAI